MKKILCTVCVLLAVADLCLAGGGGESKSAAKKIVLRVGHAQNEKGDWQKGLEVFAKEASERTKAEVEVQIFPNETLGRELDNITSIHQGTAEMVLSGDSMVNWAPYAAAVALPYAMKNGYSDVEKALARPDIGGVIEKDIIENVKLKPLGYFLRSARNLTANRKVEKYADLRGLKMRIANNPLHQKLWSAFGASANPMNWSEVFSALQNGTIEAQENPYAQIISANIYEVQKYLVLTEHIYTWIYVLVGVDVWNKLSPSQQAALQESADIATKFQHDYHKNEVREQEEFLKGKMEFISIDKTPFIETSKKVLKTELSPELYAIYEKMLNL